jgi:hypothetical protein
MYNVGPPARLTQVAYQEDVMMKTAFATARSFAGAGTVGVAMTLRPRQ